MERPVPENKGPKVLRNFMFTRELLPPLGGADLNFFLDTLRGALFISICKFAYLAIISL